MRFGILAAAMVLIISNNAFGFEGLSSIKIPIRGRNIVTYYVEKYSTIINKDITEKEVPWRTFRLIETKLKAESDERYIIDFCEGPSWDPTFEIWRLEGDKLISIGEIPALEIIIPCNGYLYTSGHTNNMFNKKRKFTIENDELKEIKQPFYYVGLDSKAMEDIDIYSDINMSTVVEHVSKGAQLTVLMNYNDVYYLIKTEYGLLGWIKIAHSRNDDIIKDVYFAGD